MTSGVIVKGIGSFYDVYTDNEVIRCRVRGKFRNMNVIPLVGDKVHINEGSDTIEPSIEEILPRTNELKRPAVSNIDYLAIVMAVKNPKPDFLLIDKLILSAEINYIKPMLVINKIDLSSEDELHALTKEYDKTNYKTYLISCKSGSGLEELTIDIKEGVTTFAGQSGVGKSSIINMLHPGLNLETGEISAKLKRGKHTTRHVELLSIPSGGLIVDTPGFSQMDLFSIESNNLQFYYPDFREFINTCKFSSCLHINEPECAIKDAVKQGLISQRRYDRYVTLVNEIVKNRRDLQ